MVNKLIINKYIMQFTRTLNKTVFKRFKKLQLNFPHCLNIAKKLNLLLMDRKRRELGTQLNFDVYTVFISVYSFFIQNNTLEHNRKINVQLMTVVRP